MISRALNQLKLQVWHTSAYNLIVSERLVLWLTGDRVKRLAVDATLRAAAPYQKSRRLRAQKENKRERRVYVEKPDMRRYWQSTNFCTRFWTTRCRCCIHYASQRLVESPCIRMFALVICYSSHGCTSNILLSSMCSYYSHLTSQINE